MVAHLGLVRAARATSWFDPDGVEDGTLVSKLARRRAGRPFGHDHQAGPFHVEDPELLAGEGGGAG